MLERIPVESIAIGKKDPLWMADYKAGIYQQGSNQVPFRIFEPKVEEGKTYPLVLWLHGVKGRGEDNLKQVQAGNSHAPGFFANELIQAQFPAYVVVPQCAMGKFWVNFTNHRIRRPLKRSMALVSHLMETLPIDATKVYVGGQSMGGFATWAALAEYPELFAAGIAVAGGGSSRRAKRYIKAPVWAFHGQLDPVVGVERSRVLIKVLSDASKTHLYTEYPTGRHDIWPLVVAEPQLAEWLFAQQLVLKKRRGK